MTDTQLCLQKYGDPSTGAFQNKYLVRHPLPVAVLAYFPVYPGPPKVKPTAIYMHRDATAALDAVLLELLQTGLIHELKTYDGCHNVRKKRGLGEYSIHAWGLALDFNAQLLPLGSTKSFSPAFLAVWRKHGWLPGSDFKGRKDPMHMQYVH